MFFIVAVLAFSNTLNSLDGCGGNVGVGVALISSVISLIPGEGAAVIRIFLSGWLYPSGFSALENMVCDL